MVGAPELNQPDAVAFNNSVKCLKMCKDNKWEERGVFLVSISKLKELRDLQKTKFSYKALRDLLSKYLKHSDETQDARLS